MTSLCKPSRRLICACKPIIAPRLLILSVKGSRSQNSKSCDYDHVATAVKCFNEFYSLPHSLKQGFKDFLHCHLQGLKIHKTESTDIFLYFSLFCSLVYKKLLLLPFNYLCLAKLKVAESFNCVQVTSCAGILLHEKPKRVWFIRRVRCHFAC